MLQAKSYRLLIVLVLCLGVFSAAYAQGGITPPSFNGGSFGGPGMAGATGNGSGGFSAHIPSGGSPGGGMGGGLGSGGMGGNPGSGGPGGGALGGGALSGGGLGAGAGAGAGGGLGSGFFSGERPGAPSGLFTAGGAAALFGGEGGLMAQLNQIREAGMSWAEFGGFGSSATGGPLPIMDALDNLDSLWASALDSEAAAALSAEISAAIAAQAEAISQGTAEAQAAAQAAYDQFWTDYYAAVDAAAQAYFDLMMEEAEALYEEAVNAATAVIDYYDEYAEWYMTYCYYYPWDCYLYAYNTLTGVYESTEAASEQPAGTITMGEVEDSMATLSTIATETFASSPEAYEAIVIFANDQLGTTVEPLYAGAITEELLAYLGYMPDEIAAYAALLTNAQAYWGLLNGGVAGVAIGDCTAAAPCTIDNMAQALSDASGGIFALNVAAPMPGDTAGALDLITTVYPALNGLSFAQVMDTEAGMAFLGTAYSVGANDSGQPLTVAKLVYAGVIPSSTGQTTVYALVAVGEAQIEAFYSLFQ